MRSESWSERLSRLLEGIWPSQDGGGTRCDALDHLIARNDQNLWMALGEVACKGRTFPRMICKERRL